MSTLTTHYSLIKPGVNDPTDEDQWGGELNDDLDDIDALIYTATNWIKRDVTTTDTATTADRNKVLLCNATGGAFSVTLPAAATAADGFMIVIKRTNSGANAVTVDGNASETIDGALTFVLSAQYDAIFLQCDGSNWNIIAKTQATAASETVAGVVELATQAEVNAGTDATRVVTPATLFGVTNRAYTSTATQSVITAVIPVDGSVPQNTEGTEILTASITPKTTTNRIRITFNGSYTMASGSNLISTAAIFKDSVADAIAAQGTTTTNAGGSANWNIVHEFVPGSTSALTIKVRVGVPSSTMTLNGAGYGGVAYSTLVLEEIRSS